MHKQGEPRQTHRDCLRPLGSIRGTSWGRLIPEWGAQAPLRRLIRNIGPTNLSILFEGASNSNPEVATPLGLLARVPLKGRLGFL